MIAPHIGDTTTLPGYMVVTDAELPAATANNQRLFVTYVAKGRVGQDVWLVSATRPLDMN